LHWLNLGNQPVQVLIEDLYLLVVPRKEDGEDPDELERRMQQVKLERLRNAEELQMRAGGVEGIHLCLHKIITYLTVLKVPTTSLKIKASLHPSSQSF
jgi:hypothetical protein